MKLIVGVGLFILICAKTVLYENRDRETKTLLAQTRSLICTISNSRPSAGIKEITAANSMVKSYSWIRTSPATPLNLFYLHKRAIAEPPLQAQPSRDQQDDQQAAHQPNAAHHRSGPPPAVDINCVPEQGSSANFSPKPAGSVEALSKVRPARITLM